MSEFVPRPFAFMRLTHEALRVGFAELGGCAERGDIEGAAAVWNGLRDVVALHKQQEEEAFFPLLDEQFDGAVERAGLRSTHLEEEEHERMIEAAIAAGDADALRRAWATWSAAFERHLFEEEEVMMPLTQRVAPTIEGRARAVRTLLDVDWNGLRDRQLPYVVSALERARPFGQLRMFVAAVQLSSGDRYDELVPVIRGALSEDAAAQLANLGHLDA